MSHDGLKLTTYFGERDRAEGRFVADALLDIYGKHELAWSLLLRGAEGFGRRHHLRTDRLLTLSEDLPLVSIAIYDRERIEAVLPQVTALKRKGLLTLERARLLRGTIAPTALPEQLHEATKLTICLGRQERIGGVPAFVAICALLQRHGIAGATALLGVDGTAHGRRERARFLGRNPDVPMTVIAVGAGEQIVRVLPELGGLLRRPLLTLERVRICKRDGALLERPHPLPGHDEHGLPLWQKLVIYSSEPANVEGRPSSPEIVRRLRAAGHAGATTLRGIWGFHGDHAPHGDRLLQLRRHVPVVTVVIDTPERIAGAFAIVDELTPVRGLVTSELVPALADAADGDRLRLAHHRF